MLALYPGEEVERASRCHGHQQKVIAIRHEFDTCPVPSTHLKPRLSVGSPGFLSLEAVEELAETSRFQIFQRVSSKQSKQTSPRARK